MDGYKGASKVVWLERAASPWLESGVSRAGREG